MGKNESSSDIKDFYFYILDKSLGIIERKITQNENIITIYIMIHYDFTECEVIFDISNGIKK